MVTRVAGRARSLVQAVRRIQRERERAGRALLNSQVAQDVQTRQQRQEVHPLHGQEVEGRPGGLQTWGRRNQINNNALGTTNAQHTQQTAPKERPRMRVRARARPGTPSYIQTSPSYPFSPCGVLYGPHRCPHCEDIPNDIFPLPPYSVDDPNPSPHYEDLFPPDYIPFPDLDTTMCLITNTRPPTPPFP